MDVTADSPMWFDALTGMMMLIGLVAHATRWHEYRDLYGRLVYLMMLFGWSTLCVRIVSPLIDGDLRISFPGAIGLVLLALGTALMAVRK